jgi:hypothetical protein
MLINELVAQGKQFQMMAYPNRSHGISEGEGTTMHLYTLMTDYFEEHLPPGPRPRPEAEAISFLGESPSDAAVAYGLANWYMAEGDMETALSTLEAIAEGNNWAAFGSIAAEADLARIQNSEFGIRNSAPATESPLD